MRIIIGVFCFFLLLASVECSDENNKVLLMPLFGSSHMLFFRDLAQELIKSGYKVSMLMLEDSKFRHLYEGIEITMLDCPGLKQADYSEIEERQLHGKDGIVDLFELMSLIFKSTTADRNWIPFLKSLNFDLLMMEFFPQMNNFAHILDTPHTITLLSGPPDQTQLKKTVGAPYHSTMLSVFEEPIVPQVLVSDTLQDRSSFMTRFRSFIAGIPSWVIFSYFVDKYCYDLAADEYKHLIGLEPKSDLILSVSVEGVLNRNSLPPYVKYIYPLSKLKDQNTKPIPGEFLKFLDNNEKNVLVAFGSAFSPSKDFLEMIFQFSQQHTEFGLIISLKRQDTYGDVYDKLQNSNQVFVASWLPQKELLESGKISLFYSHGGMNSLMESLSGGVPLLVTPLVLSDQPTNCKYVALNRYGYCLEKPTLADMNKAVELLKKNNFFRERMEHVKKVIQLKKEDPQDLIYWVKQVLEVGTQHLVPKDAIKLNFLALNDVDVHFALFVLILLILCILWAVVRRLLKLCIGKKENKLKQQ